MSRVTIEWTRNDRPVQVPTDEPRWTAAIEKVLRPGGHVVIMLKNGQWCVLTAYQPESIAPLGPHGVAQTTRADVRDQVVAGLQKDGIQVVAC
jgi:hypothetical protein